MPNLPQLSGPAVPPEQAAGVRIGTPSNQGERAMAQAIGSLGQEFAEMQMGILQKQSRLDVLTNESAYGDHMAEVQSGLDPNAPQDWPNHIKQASEGFIDQLSRKNLSPAAMDSLRERLGNYQSKVMRTVGRDAQLAQVQILKGEYRNRQDTALENGDFDLARRNVIESAGDLGLRDFEADRALMEIDKTEKFYRMDDALLNDPLEAERLLESDEFGFPETEKGRYKAKIKTAKARAESQDMDRIMGAVAIGAIKTKDDFARTLESSPNITPSMAKKAVKSWDNSKPLSYEEKSGLVDRMNTLHGKLERGEIDREEYSKGHHEMASEVYALGSRDGTGGLRTRIHQLDPAGWKAGNLSSGKTDDLDREIEQMASAFDSAGGFGKPRKGEDALTPAEALKARSVRQITEEEMKKWIKSKEGKDATDTQIQNQFMKVAAAAMVGRDVESVSKYESDYERIMKIGVLPPK